MTGAILASCDNPVEPPHSNGSCTDVVDGRCWTFLGPDGMLITTLADTPWGIFVGTRAEISGERTGVHRLDSTMGEWHFVGLDHAINSSMLMVPGDTARLLVGMIPFAEEQTDAAVYATADGGETWMEWDGGLARAHDQRSWAFALAMDPGDSNRLFMGQSRSILRSDDGGRTWQFVFGEHDFAAGGVQNIVVSPKRNGRIWTSWQTPVFSAMIDRSDDWGETWEHFSQGSYDNIITVLAVDPGTPERLWSAEGVGRIRRTHDGGETWTTAYELPIPGSVTGLILYEGTLVATSWEDTSGNNGPEVGLGLYQSKDGGDTWESLAVPESAHAALSRNLILDNDGALLIGTLNGVWRVAM